MAKSRPSVAAAKRQPMLYSRAMNSAAMDTQLQTFRAAQQAHQLTLEHATDLAQAATAQVLTAWQMRTPYARAAVTLLTELALAADPALAAVGGAALFPGLIERLNDSFDPLASSLYDQLFAQVIEHCRRVPAGRALDVALAQFGLPDEAALLRRKARLQAAGKCRWPAAQVKKILLLSRVTIGADVAITSVFSAALRERFPQAEVVWLGAAKLQELFGGAARVRALSYERGGTILTRLQAWLAVVAAVTEERRGYAPGEVLVLDPDSRLTQLGLLPVVPNDESYFFFESRSYRADSAAPLAHLAAQWSAAVFGTDAGIGPRLDLPPAQRAFGQAVAQRLRQAGRQRLVSLSFGAGGNASKQLNQEFEAGLLQALLTDAVLLLDKGGTAEERAQIDRLLTPLRAAGHKVVELNATNAPEKLAADWANATLATWDGGIGAFAGLIAASDQYLGYDSAGQHLAAALGVPVLTIFVSDNGPQFAARWQPYGSGVRQVFRTVPAGQAAAKTGEVALTEVWELYRTFNRAA